MSVIGLHGIPGCGKTLVSVGGIAKKIYKKDNRLIKRIIRKCMGVPTRVNTIYSNFPILLDKRRKIYSNIITVDDCDNRYSLIPGSTVIIDEIQSYYDSSISVRDFPKQIATFYQFHRHFDIKDMYLISQHPRRIITYMRDVISEYRRIKKYIKIPIIHLGIIWARVVYEFDDYKFAFTRSKEVKRQYDIKTKFYFFNYKKAYKSYKTKYMSAFNKDKPLLYRGTYTSLDFPEEEYDYLNYRLFGIKR
ncbi:MAG: hypothetical protein IJO43_02235 [Bacilli bacterium]|nr:hypothetical protein [Bacilli bacterium]